MTSFEHTTSNGEHKQRGAQASFHARVPSCHQVPFHVPMSHAALLSRRHPLQIPPPQFRGSCQCVGSLVSYKVLSLSRCGDRRLTLVTGSFQSFPCRCELCFHTEETKTRIGIRGHTFWNTLRAYAHCAPCAGRMDISRHNHTVQYTFPVPCPAHS